MSITPSTNLRMQFNRSGRRPRENTMRNDLSTRVPVSGFNQASGNSEQWKMTGKEDNVGFLATGSGVKQFQLSLGGWCVLRYHPFTPELRFTKHRSFASCGCCPEEERHFRFTGYGWIQVSHGRGGKYSGKGMVGPDLPCQRVTPLHASDRSGGAL
jgi:hypothetical protein